AGDRLHHRVRQPEGDDDPREVLVRPLELRLQVRGQDAERLAIEVVDDGGEEEQRPDPPAVAPGHALSPSHETRTRGSTKSTCSRLMYPCSMLMVFAVPHATPRRRTSSRARPRARPTATPPSRQSPEPTVF